MKEKLEKKIDEVLDYIISKPVEQITSEDFAILAGELRERRFREGNEEQNRKFAGLLSEYMANSPFGNAHV